MLDATGKKLLRLLQSDQPLELRCAAALVLGELGLRDAELARQLCDLLDDPEASLRAHALTAIGKLRVESTLPRLLARASEGGPEAELAAQAAARLGPKGIRGLQELMHRVAPGLRRRITAALAAAGTTGAETAAVDTLLDKDPGVVDAAARTLSSEIPSLTEAHRRALADHLLELLKLRKKERLPATSETAVLRLLAALGDSRAEPVFWDRIAPPYAPELRAAALQGLGQFPPASLSREKLKRLLACATDADFRVAASAVMLLKAVPVARRTLGDWLVLLYAPDAAVRRMALEKLGDHDTPEVATALLGQLGHSDTGLRDAALARLARLQEGRAALARALLNAGTPDEAWLLARAQAPFVQHYGPELREQVFAAACAHLEAGDRGADALLFLLREADARGLRDRLEERARALRQKKQYAAALAYLRLLARDPACGAAIRCELAACGLKLSARDLAADARAADPCLQQFASLIHSHEEELLDFMQKAKWLEPEDLFYLGFHFAERDRQEKQFGGEVLRLLIKRSPRSKLARDARSKLAREGLE